MIPKRSYTRASSNHSQTVVGTNTWVAHKNSKAFGPDAAGFRPERWLETDKDNLSRMERSWMPVSTHPDAANTILKNVGPV